MKILPIVFSLFFFMPVVAFGAEVRDIAFPVDGEYTFTDTFGAPRGGGRAHEGIDIMAEKMTPVVAAVDGVIGFMPMTEPSYGFLIYLKGDDGYEYGYIHLNNDTPGTDDGNGGAQYAYAPGIASGVRVAQGQLLGWVGDSGNAEWTDSHLHFEIRTSNDVAINPYESLLAAERRVTEVTAKEPEQTLISTVPLTINDDKMLVASANTNCTSNTLIKTEESSAVYYCGRDGSRYVFQNEKTFFSWYDGFDEVVTISSDQMASLPLKGVVTYKPGSYLLKLQTNPKVYAVGENGTLQWVTSEELAINLFGNNWAAFVHDLPDSFFPAYRIGPELSQ